MVSANIRTFGSLIQKPGAYSSYLVACFLISIPIIYGVWEFTYSQGVPSGGDPADHALFILRILQTGSPLVAYSQFPDAHDPTESAGLVFYPSLLHTTIAALTFIVTLGSTSFAAVLSVMQAFMFIQYLIGIGAYALLIKGIIDSVIDRNRLQNQVLNHIIVYYGLLILAFGLFIYSTSPIVKTFRDGGYGEILSMWCLFPFYLYFLVRKRWRISAVLLAAIASTHNLSFIMTLAATLPYFSLLLITRDFPSLRKSKDFLVIFLALFLPALTFFYAPTILTALNAGTGQGVPVARDYVIDQVKPNLYYAGIVAAAAILFIDYKKLGWLSGWSALYFPVFSSSIFAERFARELSLPFGLIVGVAVSIGIYKVLSLRYLQDIDNSQEINSHRKAKITNRFVNKQVIVVLPIVIILLPMSYLYFSDRFELFADPHLLNYYNKAFAESNTYLANLDLSTIENNTVERGNNRTTIVLFGVNPWLKPAVYHNMRVLEVLPPEDEQYLSAIDKETNRSLRTIIESPNSEQAFDTMKKYNIRYVFVSDILPGRWYSSSYLSLDSLLDKFEMDSLTPYARLEKEISDDGVQLRIYFIDHSKFKTE